MKRSMAVIPLSHVDGGLRDAVQILRRALRDLRDGEAVKNRRWSDVGFGGVAVGDAAWLVVLHDQLDRQEIQRVLQRRWPSARVSDDLTAPVQFGFNADDLVELALCRRGGSEPMKIIIGLRQNGFPGLCNIIQDDQNGFDDAMPFLI